MTARIEEDNTAQDQLDHVRDELTLLLAGIHQLSTRAQVRSEHIAITSLYAQAERIHRLLL